MYPVQLDIDAPLKVANWRPLVHWLLAIPHMLVAQVLQSMAGVLAFISFFTILFTKQIPDGIYNFQVMALRYNWRTTSYFMYLREPYPPFEFEMTTADPGTDPAIFSVEKPQEFNRWLPLVKWLLLIPHFFVLLFLILAQGLVLFLAFFVVLFTGAWPEGMRRFAIGVNRWGWRVSSYMYLLTDEYPPFSLD
jgi:hypothetical protein